MLVYLDFSFIGGGLTCDTVHLAGTLPSVQEIHAFWLHLISQKYTLHCTFLFGSVALSKLGWWWMGLF